MTNQLRSGKIIPRNGATDVAAFKFYLDEVKCRLSGRYGAGNGGLCRGTEQCPVGTDSDAIRCLASTAGKASYLIVEPLVLRSPGGRGCNAASAAAPKTRREELSRIASVNLKKASSGCRSAVSSRVLAFCVMVVCLVATLGVTAANLRLTYVTDSNGAKQVILTSATDPAKVMSLSGIQSEEGDQVYYTAFSGNLATLNIERAFSVNIQADGQTYPVKMVYGTVADALQRAGITLEGDDYTEPALDRLVTAGTPIVVHRVDYQDRVETQAIPYDTEYVYTSLYFRNTGRTTTVQHGAEGQQTVTTRDRYVDGELENSIVVDSTTTVQPTNHVIKTYGAGAPVSPLTGPDGTTNAPASYSKVLTGKATGYYSKTGKGSSGLGLGYGTVAVDPDVIPYGTKLYITSTDGKFVYGYAVATDTGIAVQKGQILVDLFYETYAESVINGAIQVNVYVVG